MTLTREPIYADAPSGKREALCRRIVELFSAVGRCGRLAVESLACLPGVLARRDARAAFLRQLYAAGIRTLPVITVVGLFTGMILGLQVGLALRRFNQELYLGAAVMLTLLREMGPFVTGICLSACVGSAMAAELGTMTVNDEVAALEIMSISPVRYLAAPRMGALLVMAPILAFYACVLGVVGGGLVAQTQLNVAFRQYMSSAMSIAATKDLFVGLLKAGIFGVVIGAVSCHQGFSTRRGARDAAQRDHLVTPHPHARVHGHPRVLHRVLTMIRFENVVKRFDGREVLSGVSFEIAKGEVLAVVGPSGTGKSVLLKHLVRLLTPTSGRVWLDDVEISAATGDALEAIRARFGYLFQGGALLGWLTVAENVALPLRERTRLASAEIDARVAEALAAVELTEAADRYPAEISGGRQKRAGLARAIVRRSDIVLYDEPTSGLDPVTSVTINRLIRRLNRKRGITSVVVTHDLQGALLFADRILMLKGGHVVELAPAEAFVRSTKPDVRDFLDAQFITADSFQQMKAAYEKEF